MSRQPDRYHKPLNLPVVVSVFAVAALAVFLVIAYCPSPQLAVPEPVVEPEPVFDEVGYYNDEAALFEAALPADKEVVAQRIDSVNHRLYYIEHSDFPSCYSYDLDNRLTSVVFSGSDGFEADSMAFTIRKLDDWRWKDNCLYFVARNGMPNRNYTNETLVVWVNTDGDVFHYLDFGADAYFTDESHLVVVKAKFLHRKFFSSEDVYTQAPKTYEF